MGHCFVQVFWEAPGGMGSAAELEFARDPRLRGEGRRCERLTPQYTRKGETEAQRGEVAGLTPLNPAQSSLRRCPLPSSLLPSP